MTKGVREWYGSEAKLFLDIRNKCESQLVKEGFEYYYGSLVSKRGVYRDKVDVLGEVFMKNLVRFQLSDQMEQELIIAPEGTFRVYDYLIRNNMLEGSGKVFYSQECVRNESAEDVGNGKTFSFWQIGFEVFGYEALESTALSFQTLKNCYDEINLTDWWFRVSDKRFLAGNLQDISLKERRYIYDMIDECGEDGRLFYDTFVKNGGSKELAKKVSDILLLGNDEMTISDLERYNVNSTTNQAIEFLSEVTKELNRICGEEYYKLIPFMPKSWDACDSLLFDARVSDYPYAISGGGSLYAFNEEKYVEKFGAGIGVTRLVEYLAQKENLGGIK